MAQVNHDSVVWPVGCLHSIARRTSCRASSKRRSLWSVSPRLLLDGLLDIRRERIAAAQLARINPAWLPVIGKRRTKIAHECVVLRAVRDE